MLKNAIADPHPSISDVETFKFTRGGRLINASLVDAPSLGQLDGGDKPVQLGFFTLGHAEHAAIPLVAHPTGDFVLP